MPSTKGLEFFVRRKQPNDGDWFELIEARRALLKPYLDSFTLPELGSLELLHGDNFMHELQVDGPTVIGDKQRFSLKTQGIFHKSLVAVEKIPNSGYNSLRGGEGVYVPDGVGQVWGLTRSGLWVLVSISFVGEAGYKSRGYERAKTVEIREVELYVIVEKTREKPLWVWKELGKAIKEYAEFRKELYDEALNLARMVQIEELTFSLIPK